MSLTGYLNETKHVFVNIFSFRFYIYIIYIYNAIIRITKLNNELKSYFIIYTNY
jgi:hypothetical protein